ncbi:GGDEF/EAL domain-containing response regulator [Methylobacter svalbardensis]|uniref:GGDEF/EAL domain-containing response regulator n=1 Tax=Methylobacter svalbardensis TaxID=3080016 RepID=UPI0030EDCCCA
MTSASDIFNASILIVDDKEANVLLLERILHDAGYTSITSTMDSLTVCELYRKNRYDLILLDLQMPVMDGFQVMEGLKEIELDGYLPVLVITAEPNHKLRALQLGARDFISKPFDRVEVLTRLHNMLEVRLLHTKSKHHSLILEQTVQELRKAESGLHATEVALSEEKAALDDHVLQLQQANEHLVVATIEALTLAEEIEKAKVQMVHLAQHDALTDLPNRLLLNDRLAQATALADRHGKQLAVMFLDLDRFKLINDSLGHTVGDQLLQSVAERLMAGVRNSDTVCRQGGDEFVILLADVEHAEDAALSAQKILDALTVPHLIDQLELHVSVSIGISIYPDDGQDADTLIKNADTAMYHAKESGRNNYQFFEQDMNVLAVERHFIESGLRLALERQEFILHYQPKINLETGTISGVEALVRWQHPLRGLIMPEQFVWIAEDCGLIVLLGTWVLSEACRQAQAWQDAGLPPVPVAVNISAVQFRHKDFLGSLTGILKDTGLAPSYLELELTESVLMHDADSTASVLEALKALGLRLAIDDFGTGYSSLSYLKRFPIDTLKIDQSFMRDITHATTDSDDASIVAAVVSMGKSLNQRVIAEGVETREQLAFLQAQGCGEGQGFYFSQPLSSEELVELLRTGISSAILS